MQRHSTEMTAVVLGAAAGGGFPQWNCACALCSLARAGDPRIKPATQASLAVSGNGAEWVIVGASPDLRQQILQTPQLWPQAAGRHSPITGVVLVGGDVDALAGLLVLRERQAFTVYAPAPLLDLLRANPIFGVLNPEVVRLEPIHPRQPVSCGAGLQLTLLEMPGKVPLYMEEPGAGSAEAGPTYAARLQAGASTMVFAPACADISDTVRRQLHGADAVFFDGTLFTDDEMIAAGLGIKTGHRMGHVPVSGPGGSLEFLAGLPGRRILMHINNTNPILLSDSAERRQVEAAGVEVAYDGMEVRV